jgi:hypothetical protein
MAASFSSAAFSGYIETRATYSGGAFSCCTAFSNLMMATSFSSSPFIGSV